MSTIPLHNRSSKVLPIYKNGLVPVSENDSEQIVISFADSLQVIPLREILYLKSESNYTQIRLLNGCEYLVSKTLKVFDSKLNNSFMRVHHSYVINLKHIKSFSLKTSKILMQKEITIPVSRSNKAGLIAYLRGFEL